MRLNICIVGTGYVGIASAIGFAQLGCRVTGYDVLRDRIAGLRAGVMPYHENGIAELLASHQASNEIAFFENFHDAARGADFIVLTVGTPALEDGSADMSGLAAAVEQIESAQLPRQTIVVVRSTVPVGTSEAIAERLRGRHTVLYQPEFLREGSAVYDFMHPDRIVVGAQAHTDAISYVRIFEALRRPVIVTKLREAELIKGWSNAFLAMKISFANEVANYCTDNGASADDVLRGVGYDARIGSMFLAPGIGFGGPCFEKDVRSLHHVALKQGSASSLLAAVLEVNARQPSVVRETLERHLGGLQGRTIGVWGISFKAGTSDYRDSIALRVIEDLAERGAAVLAYDPGVRALPPTVRCAVRTNALSVTDADALIVLTEWPQFASIDPRSYASRVRGRLVVDGRNTLDPERVAAAGLTYCGIGRSLGPYQLQSSLAYAG